MNRPFLLLVDDAPELADIIAYLGKRSGIEVASCRDVPSAWDFLQTRRPDLLLVDVNLPGLRGPDLCRRVRATPALADLPIALFSNWGLPADVAAGVEAGADYVVSKDLVSRPAELGDRLVHILRTCNSRGLTDRVAWQGGPADAPVCSDRAAALNEALRTVALRLVGPEVLRLVLRRALVHSRTPPQAEPALARCVTADGLAVDPPVLCAALDASAFAILVASIEGQLGRLLGAEASRPFREALAVLVPGLSELSSH